MLESLELERKIIAFLSDEDRLIFEPDQTIHFPEIELAEGDRSGRLISRFSLFQLLKSVELSEAFQDEVWAVLDKFVKNRKLKILTLRHDRTLNFRNLIFKVELGIAIEGWRHPINEPQIIEHRFYADYPFLKEEAADGILIPSEYVNEIRDRKDKFMIERWGFSDAAAVEKLLLKEDRADEQRLLRNLQKLIAKAEGKK